MSGALAARAAAAGLVALAAVYLWLATRLPMGTMAAPGAGFFPVAVGAFLCAVGLGLLLRLLLRPRSRQPVAPTALAAAGEAQDPEMAAAPAGARRRLAVTAAALAGFCLGLPWLGYPVAAFGFVLLLLRELGGARWSRAALAALASAALSYYLFAVLLGVPLPRGLGR